MASYYLYLALGEDRAHFGFTHDPYLDSALLAGRGYTRTFAAAQPLPIDLAVFITHELQGRALAYHPLSSTHLIHPSLIHPVSRHPWPAHRRLLKAIAGFRPRRGRQAAWGKGGGQPGYSQVVRSWMELVRQHLRRRGFGHWRQIEFRRIETGAHVSAGISLELLEAIGQLLQGRVLSYDEVRSLLEQREQTESYPLRDLLQACALAGRLEIWPGILSLLDDYHVCCRCGERQQFEESDCPLCGRSNCVVCLACRSLGEIRSCRELYYGSFEEVPRARQVFPGLEPQLSFELTRAQAEAAADFKGYVDDWLDDYLPNPGREAGAGEQRQEPLAAAKSRGFPIHSFLQRAPKEDERACLIWAVCGAGKTEIAFEGLALALGAGLRAVFAVPRRDVVVEIAERAKAAFPTLNSTALYGGARHPEDLGQLVIATTHQLLRFNSYFDLVILDEADAFPYAGSAVLYRALQRTVKPRGLKVFMTATPSPAMLKAARRGAVHLITVPARHHGYPVPVPKVIIDRRHLVPERGGGQRGREKAPALHLPKEFWLRLAESLAAGSRVFVFVPRIWLVEAVAREAAASLELSDIPIFGTHSRDPKRNEQREQFRQAAPSVMVTTSVLERGITVSKADVIVLYAHDDLYDARTLIQMAGRSGRTASCPTGSVCFIAAAKTKSIQWAVDRLEEVNAAAWERGLLVTEKRAEDSQT